MAVSTIGLRKTGAALAATGQSLRTAKITALFCAVVGALYAFAQVEPPPQVALFLLAGPAIAVIPWLQRDAARTGSVHDLGFLLWLSWPVVIPWYVWKTRGWPGWKLGLGLFAVIGSAYVGWFFGALLSYALQYGGLYFGAS